MRRGVALLAAGAPLLLLGALYGYAAWANARLPAPEVDPAASLVFRAPREHPVSPAMLAAARELGKAPAPAFGLVDTEARWYTLAALTKDKPLVLFFVELECPCCKGAKVFVDRIQERYGDVCNVVGVINAEPPVAKAWANAVQPAFPVLCDPGMETIRAYKAVAGVYTTLVAPGGRVVKAYPGYSQAMLTEMGRKIERLTGIAPHTLKVADAPPDMLAGCTFPTDK
ncbi:MAG: peroxiredoxin family protein [Fimbriimonas sp.]